METKKFLIKLLLTRSWAHLCSSSSFFLQLSVRQWDPMPHCSPLSGQVLPLCHRVSSPGESGLASFWLLIVCVKSMCGAHVLCFEDLCYELRHNFLDLQKLICLCGPTEQLSYVIPKGLSYRRGHGFFTEDIQESHDSHTISNAR